MPRAAGARRIDPPTGRPPPGPPPHSTQAAARQLLRLVSQRGSRQKGRERGPKTARRRGREPRPRLREPHPRCELRRRGKNPPSRTSDAAPPLLVSRGVRRGERGEPEARSEGVNPKATVGPSQNPLFRTLPECWLTDTALSCRPPVNVARTDRRPPDESTPEPGGRRLEGLAGPGVPAGQLQCLVRRHRIALLTQQEEKACESGDVRGVAPGSRYRHRRSCARALYRPEPRTEPRIGCLPEDTHRRGTSETDRHSAEPRR